MISKYLRKCPNCIEDIFYTNKKNRNKAERKKFLCKKCRFNKKRFVPNIKERKCPICKNIIKYNSIYECFNANKQNSTCRKCGSKKSSITLKKYYKIHPNPMQGRSIYSVWLEKYGKEIADKKFKEYCENHADMTGKNNPMYGKPSPNGSGCGWKGWYKNHYFRSLRELSYMIYLDENNIKWESAEQKIFLIKYKDYLGFDKTYRPDFLINNKLVEIKPLRLHNTPLIKAKVLAAKGFCAKNNLEFEIIDYPINAPKIKEYLDKKMIKFSGNYKERFLNYIK